MAILIISKGSSTVRVDLRQDGVILLLSSLELLLQNVVLRIALERRGCAARTQLVVREVLPVDHLLASPLDHVGALELALSHHGFFALVLEPFDLLVLEVIILFNFF